MNEKKKGGAAKAERMEGVIEREVKRPGRKDKPCLPCLDISLCLLGMKTLI